MSTLKVNQIQNLNGDVLLSSSGSDSNITISGELRGPATLIIDPAAIGDNTGTVQIKGDLQVDGVTTTINSTTLTLDNKNITLADGATTDLAADGGGITLKGASDKTITWLDSTDAWTFSEHISIASGKEFRINGVKVLDATSLGSAIAISSTQNISTTGTVSDGNGNLRILPQNSKTSAYTLVSTDTGRHISITTGGITVPAGVFSVGSIITIYNNSTSNQTITQGASVTLRQSGTANTGNRTLSQYGVATILCVSNNVFVISGSGLS